MVCQSCPPFEILTFSISLLQEYYYRRTLHSWSRYLLYSVQFKFNYSVVCNLWLLIWLLIVCCDHRISLWTCQWVFAVLVQFIKKGTSVNSLRRPINRSTRVLSPVDSFLILRVYFFLICKNFEGSKLNIDNPSHVEIILMIYRTNDIRKFAW